MDLRTALSLISILLSVLSQLCSGQQMDLSADITSPVLGQEFTFKCTIGNPQSLNVVQQNLFIYKKAGNFGSNADDGVLVVTQLDGRNGSITGTLPDIDRLSYDSVTFTLTVSNTECSDSNQMQYRCVLEYYTTAGGIVSSKQTSKAAAMLEVKARPQNPTMSAYSSSVEESQDIHFTCTANVGRPGKGTIRWRISPTGTTPDVPAEGDSRVATITNTGDPPCTINLTSTLTLTSIQRNYQDFTVACFVTNADFNPNLPQNCADAGTDMCQSSTPITIFYPMTSITITKNEDEPYETSSVTLTCFSDSSPAPTYTWVKVNDENRTLTAGMEGNQSKLTLTNLNLTADAGEYNCTATNSYFNSNNSASTSIMLTISPVTTTQPTTSPATTVPPTTKTDRYVENNDDDSSTMIIAICVSLAVVLIILVVVGYVIYKKRQPKSVIEEPSEKPYKHNLSFQNPQPDLVADEKKFNNPSLNSSFQNEDGLMYADLTYDNRPRSRKPMALGDTASEYSDVQMPQV